MLKVSKTSLLFGSRKTMDYELFIVLHFKIRIRITIYINFCYNDHILFPSFLWILHRQFLLSY
jgi:hypothetical protein